MSVSRRKDSFVERRRAATERHGRGRGGRGEVYSEAEGLRGGRYRGYRRERTETRREKSVTFHLSFVVLSLNPRLPFVISDSHSSALALLRCNYRSTFLTPLNEF